MTEYDIDDDMPPELEDMSATIAAARKMRYTTRPRCGATRAALRARAFHASTQHIHARSCTFPLMRNSCRETSQWTRPPPPSSPAHAFSRTHLRRLWICGRRDAAPKEAARKHDAGLYSAVVDDASKPEPVIQVATCMSMEYGVLKYRT